MIKQYRNFFIESEHRFDGVFMATIHADKDGESLALFQSPIEAELDKCVRMWIDEKLANNKYFVREYRRSKKFAFVDALQAWLS